MITLYEPFGFNPFQCGNVNPLFIVVVGRYGTL